MNEFPFNEISDLTMKLHNLQKGADHTSNRYVYRISIDPSACSYEIHMSDEMFRTVLNSYPSDIRKVTISFLNQSVHLSATIDGSIVLVCCILSCDMIQSADDNQKSVQQLYAEYCERTDWPYATQNSES